MALKQLIHQMLQEIGELGSTTDRFQSNLTRYADTIGAADSLESLAGVVREMVEESRTVQSVVAQTQSRLNTEHSRATELTERVKQLEDEIRRLSDEVSTDPLDPNCQPPRHDAPSKPRRPAWSARGHAVDRFV